MYIYEPLFYRQNIKSNNALPIIIVPVLPAHKSFLFNEIKIHLITPHNLHLKSSTEHFSACVNSESVSFPSFV